MCGAALQSKPHEFLRKLLERGAAISPLIMSHFLKQNGNWQGGYRFISIIQMILALIMFITALPLWERSPILRPDELHGEPALIGNREAIKKRGVIFAALSFFFSIVRRRRPSASGRRPILSARAGSGSKRCRPGWDSPVLLWHHGRPRGYPACSPCA
ncbi:MAG: hypothetical protein R2912_05125 [Eubacteriales bacterium]